jgi:hypothetical protein
MHTPLTYLASPYTHADKWTMAARAQAAAVAAGKLMAQGIVVFSPIAHSHPIAVACPALPQCDFEFWMKFDRAFLECSQKLIVLKLHGWQESHGVTQEIRIAQELGIPVEFMEPV